MAALGSDSAVRVCVGVLVAVLHLAALLLVLTNARVRPDRANDSRALTLVNIERSERTQPVIRLSEPALSAPRLGDSNRTKLPSTEENNATSDPATIPDWRGSMEAAARAAVGKAISEESFRSMGPIERPQAGSAAAPSIFETPRRKAGDIDHDDVQGRTLIWHDAHCFTELRFPTIKDSNALVGAPNPPKCMRPIGERKARGDLFEGIEGR